MAAMEAMVELQLNNYEAVIEELEDILSPDRLINQSDTILVQAYEAAGQSENALLYSQVYMFIHLHL